MSKPAVTVIDTPPILSGDPRVYTDPYPDSKGADLVREDCWKCGGDGRFHGKSGWEIKNPRGAGTFKGCFACMGVGYRLLKVSSIRARVRRDVKAILRHDAQRLIGIGQAPLAPGGDIIGRQGAPIQTARGRDDAFAGVQGRKPDALEFGVIVKN